MPIGESSEAPCAMGSCLLRTVLVGFVALGLLASAAWAQGKVDCSTAYRSFLDKLERGNVGRISPERHAALTRKAQRVYDACRTGDLENSKALFERLDGGKF